jgi:hypothetical protein
MAACSRRACLQLYPSRCIPFTRLTCTFAPQVVLSTDNIFNRCRGRSKIGYPAESNPLQQLDVVGNFVSDLGAIVRMYRIEQQRKAAKAEEAAAAATSGHLAGQGFNSSGLPAAGPSGMTVPATPSMSTIG